MLKYKLQKRLTSKDENLVVMVRGRRWDDSWNTEQIPTNTAMRNSSQKHFHSKLRVKSSFYMVLCGPIKLPFLVKHLVEWQLESAFFFTFCTAMTVVVVVDNR